MGIEILFFIAILVMSVIIHEVSHGYAAYLLGDTTARDQGRLTLNPVPHIDLVGSVLVPLMLILSKAGFLIGWAKPVPYNPYNLRNQRWGTFAVAISGVTANFLLALIFGAIIRFSGLSAQEILQEPFYVLLVIIVGLNLILGIFNLIPVPPLDGSKVLFSLLPYRYHRIQEFMEQYFLFLIIILFFVAPVIIMPIFSHLFAVVTGLPPGIYSAALPF